MSTFHEHAGMSEQGMKMAAVLWNLCISLEAQCFKEQNSAIRLVVTEPTKSVIKKKKNSFQWWI